jgi:hypothetical protein
MSEEDTSLTPSELVEEFGTRSKPVMGTCGNCGDPEPLEFLSADGDCRLCTSMRKLRETMEERGSMDPMLFPHPVPGQKPRRKSQPEEPPPEYEPEQQAHSQLPPSDR